MIHRGVIGTTERMMAYLIELYAGAFRRGSRRAGDGHSDRRPHIDYAHEVLESLRAAGLRAELTPAERMNAKIPRRTAPEDPVHARRRRSRGGSQAVAVRTRAGEDLKSMPVFPVHRPAAGRSHDGAGTRRGRTGRGGVARTGPLLRAKRMYRLRPGGLTIDAWSRRSC